MLSADNTEGPTTVRTRRPFPDDVPASTGPQQLVARIKRSSKYAYQAPKGRWFDVRVVPYVGYGLRGNNNNYRFGDVVFGIRLDDGTIVELK